MACPMASEKPNAAVAKADQTSHGRKSQAATVTDLGQATSSV